MTAPREPWFERVEVDEVTSCLTEPGADPLLAANTWLVRGRDRAVLIDAGLGVSPLRPHVPEAEIVILTHAHLDHMGGAHEFEQVWAHASEPVDVAGRGSLHGPTLAGLLGLSEELPELLLTDLPAHGFEPADYELRPVRPTRALSDQDQISLGDRALTVLHLPGHTAGSIALLDRDRAELYTGDVLYDDVLLDDLAESDRDAYAMSLRRLLDLHTRDGIATVHPGHGPSFDGVRLVELIDQYLTADRHNPERE